MDYLLLLTAGVAGLIGAPLGVIVLIASILTAMTAPRKWAIAHAYPDVGTSRIMIGAMLLSLANNTTFTLLSFLLGRGFFLLV